MTGQFTCSMRVFVRPAAAGQQDYSLKVTNSQWTLVAIMGLVSGVFAL